jgi:hypothetical protein
MGRQKLTARRGVSEYRMLRCKGPGGPVDQPRPPTPSLWKVVPMNEQEPVAEVNSEAQLEEPVPRRVGAARYQVCNGASRCISEGPLSGGGLFSGQEALSMRWLSWKPTTNIL